MEWIWEGSRAPLKTGAAIWVDRAANQVSCACRVCFIRYCPASPGRDREDGIVRLAETRVPLAKKRETGREREAKSLRVTCSRGGTPVDSNLVAAEPTIGG
jgi:hypothetical protein